ncbi:chemotaxis protein CheW [Paenibacillus sp. YSY-4.3]
MKAAAPGQYIELVSGHERYGLKLECIHEIITMREITEIPLARVHVKGVINLRSRIVPVISLRARLRLREVSYMRASRIVVVNAGEEIVGIIVDRVNRVVTLQHIQPPSERLGKEFFLGADTTEDGLIHILNLEQLLQP